MKISATISTSVAAATLTLLGGCLDFEAVTRPVQSSSPAMISLSATLNGHSGIAHDARMRARVLPATDEHGPRLLLSDTLWMGNRPVLPIAGEDGALYYALDWRVEEDSEVRFRLPTVSRVAESPSIVTWQPVRRVDPDTVRLTRGADLILRMSSSTTRPQESEDSWTLYVQGKGGSVTIHNQGATPDFIVIPATMMATLIPGPDRLIYASLTSRQSLAWERRDVLQLHTSFLSILYWVVEIVEAQPDG